MAKDIELSVGLNTKDLESQSKEIEKLIQKAFNSSGSNTTLKSMALQLQKAFDKSKQLNAEVERLKHTQVPTQEFAELTSEIESTQDELNKVYDSMEKMEQADTAFKISNEYQDLSNQADTLSANLDRVTDSMEEMDALRSDSGAFEGFASEESLNYYNKLKTDAEQYETELSEVQSRMQQMRDEHTMLEESEPYARLENQASELNSKLNTLYDTETQMNENGQAYVYGIDTAQGAQAVQQAGYMNTQVDILATRLGQAVGQLSSLGAGWKEFKTKASSAISSVVTALKTKLQSSIKSTKNTSNNSFSSMLKKVLAYGAGILSVSALFSKIRSVISDGLDEMVQDFDDVDNSASELYNSWNTFKSSIVSAFEPIYTYVVPALTTMIDYLTEATNSLANFFANLTGASTYKKAIKQNNDYADSLSSASDSADEATEKLADYDELLVVDSDSDSSSSSSGSTDTWQWEEVETTASSMADTLSNIWDVFKSAWENKGQAVIDAATSAWNSLKSLISSIGDTIYDVFTNGTGEAWLESLLDVAESVLLTVSDIATAFEEAWDTDGTGEALVTAFFEMLTDINNLIVSITDSWREAWNSDGSGATIIGNYLDTITNIETAISNIASNFQTAWETASVGTSIMETIVGFAESISGFFSNISASTAEWSENLDFYPLLEGVDGALASVKGVLDEILSVGESIYNKFILPVVEHIVESSLPTFLAGCKTQLDGIKNGLSKINFDAIFTALSGIVNLGLDVLLTTFTVQSEALSGIWESVGTIIGSLVDIFEEFFEAIGIDTTSEEWQTFKDVLASIVTYMNPITLALKSLQTVLSWVADFISWIADDATWDAVIEVGAWTVEEIIEAFTTLVDTVKGIWDSITGFFQDGFDAIVELFDPQTWKDFWSALWQDIKDVFATVKEWFKGVFSGAWTNIKEAFATVKTWFSEKFSGAWDAIKSVFSPVSEFFSGIWDKITGVFDGVKDWFKEKFDGAWSAIKDIFDGTNGVTTFFSGIWDKIKDTWDSLGTSISDAIGDAVKSAINTVIGLIEDKINDAIDLINGAIDLINLIPGVECGYVDYVDLPEFARGGVVNRATMGIFGEAGTEAVVPLENNLGWLDKLANMITDRAIPSIVQGLVLPMSEEFMKAVGGETSQTQQLTAEDIANAVAEAIDMSRSDDDNPPIVIQIDGKTVAQVVWNESEKRYKQTGLRPAYT